MRQEKQTTKQNSTSTESSKIEKDEFACNKCKPNYIFALRSCTKYSAVLFLGVKKKKKAYPQEEPAHFPKKPHFNIPARMDLLQCNESPALLPCTLMYSQQCS
jgi:hypothetical protein